MLLLCCTFAPASNVRAIGDNRPPNTQPSQQLALPEITTTKTADGTLRIAIDEEALADACRRLELPPPPPLSAVEPDSYIRIFAAISSIAKNPTPENFAYLGHLYYGHAFRENAVVCYQRAARLDDADHRWPHLLGRLFHELGREDQALKTLERAARLNNAYAATFAQLGDLYLSQGRNDDATRAFERYAVLAPDDAYAPFSQGRVAYQRGDLNAAIQHLEHALNNAPNAHQITYLYGQTLARLGRRDQAAKFLAPTADATSQVGITYPDPLLQQVHRQAQSVRALTIELEKLTKAGRWDDAINTCKTILQRHPDTYSMLYNLASLYRRTEQYDQALATLRRILQVKPDYAPAHCGLAEVHRSMGSPDHALASVDRALQLKPDYARAFAVRGLVYMDRRDWSAAERAFDAALKITPKDHSYVYYLGLALEEQQRKDEAAKMFQRVLQLQPSHSGAQRHLAELEREPPQP